MASIEIKVAIGDNVYTVERWVPEIEETTFAGSTSIATESVAEALGEAFSDAMKLVEGK
jgi:hypothetical protein